MKTWVFGFLALRVFIHGAEEFFILPTAWYYIKSFGQTKTFLGLVLSAYGIAGIFAGPITGRLGDRFRRIKSIVIFSFFLKAVADFIYTIRVSEYFPLVGRFLSGIAAGSNAVFYGEIVLYTQEQYRAKVFIFLDGLYTLGSSFGPTFSSSVTFNVNILGWRIDAGNSSGLVLGVIWLILSMVALCLPNEFGDSVTSDEKSLILLSDDYQGPATYKQCPNDQPPRFRCNPRVYCLFYLTFLSLFYSSVVTFYTPLLALEHFHLKFIHVKLLFLTSSMFTIALFLLIYISAEYFDERKLLAFLMLLQISAIAILTYFAFRWESVSEKESYILIIYICLGSPYFAMSLCSSLMSRITHQEDAAFYQGSLHATTFLGVVVARITSGFIFTQTSLLLFCLGLVLCWGVGAFWFSLEYGKFVSIEIKTWKAICTVFSCRVTAHSIRKMLVRQRNAMYIYWFLFVRNISMLYNLGKRWNKT